MSADVSRHPSDARSALLVIDMQYDFMPGGALAVAEGDALVPLINRLGLCLAHTDRSRTGIWRHQLVEQVLQIHMLKGVVFDNQNATGLHG